MKMYLTRLELAELLKVGAETVDRYRRAGLPSIRMGGEKGSIRFDPIAVEAWMQAQSSQPSKAHTDA